MATLNLSDSELIKVRSSWAAIIAKNHYEDGNFVSDVFVKLLEANPELKSVFADKVVYEEQKELLNELLKFTMTFLHDEMVLNECMEEFIKENPNLVKVGVNYLEPMGAVIIKTLRDSLGGDRFNVVLETLWIKVYIYIANYILQNDTSEVDSIISNTNKSFTSDEEILPLNIKKDLTSPAPLAPVNKTKEVGANTIRIDLGGNEKYKGFRRSITENPKTPVLIKVPANFMSPCDFKPTAPTLANRSNSASPQLSEPSLLASFDPRPLRSRSCLEEPILTPRSSRRNTFVQLQELELDFEIKDASQIHPFDPRRMVSHKRTPSDLSLNMEFPERLASISSNENHISDVDDEYKLEDDQIDFSQTINKHRSPFFDPNSFGIKGLAPIVESEYDEERFQYSDNSSSHYAANSDKESRDDYSSRASSLSLHNLGYKSSISSGSGNSPVIEKAHKSTYSDVSFMAPLSLNPYPMLSRAFLSSVPSLTSRSSTGNRASLGFMRSSFILKKEMQELGYNNPENVVMKPHLQPATRSMVNISNSRSLTSLKLAAPSLSITNDTKLSSFPMVERAPAIAASPTQAESTKKDKSSFRRKFRSIFGSSSTSSSSPSRKPTSAAISAPAPKPKPSNDDSGIRASNITHKSSSSVKIISVADSIGRSSNRVSSFDLRMGPMKAPPSGYANSVYLRNNLDSGSINSSTSGKSGFSFFKRSPKVKYHDDGLEKKVNKYLVTKVPYKTVYVKDLIR